jgi:hypothetical protein
VSGRHLAADGRIAQARATQVRAAKRAKQMADALEQHQMRGREGAAIAGPEADVAPHDRPVRERDR